MSVMELVNTRDIETDFTADLRVLLDGESESAGVEGIAQCLVLYQGVAQGRPGRLNWVLSFGVSQRLALGVSPVAGPSERLQRVAIGIMLWI